MTSLFSRGPERTTESTWLDEHAERWLDQGLVTPDQVEAIRAYEQTETGTEVGPRFTLMAELAVYLGSVVALMSGTMIVGRSWESLTLAARVGIGLAIAALGFAAGARLIRLDDETRTRRLASFMWLIGTGGAALAAGTLADRADVQDPGWNLVIIGIPVLALGGALWRNLDRPLQVLTAAIGAGLVLGGSGALLSIPPWIGGILVWSAGVAIATAAVTQRLRPELYVLGVAAITAMIGALMLTDVSEVFGAAAATATAAGIVAVALARRRTPILVIGVLAFLQSLQGLLMTTLDGAVAALVVSVAGIAVVVVVLVRSTRRSAPPTP
jgi:MFS family permease